MVFAVPIVEFVQRVVTTSFVDARCEPPERFTLEGGRVQ
jgi:hypothetical protein